jgi:hypothetical protein
MRGIALAALLLCAALPTGIAAAKDNAGVVALEVAPTALKADSAYILLRTSTAKSGIFAIQHVFLRVPSDAELEAYRAARKLAYDAALPKLTQKAQAKGKSPPTIDEFEFDYAGRANAFVVQNKHFLEDGEMRTLLLEVPVGKYILYGSTLSQGLVMCNCLGTVSFEARAGVITDIGSLYVDKVHKPSPIPHLEDNLGEQMFQYGFVFGQALVPADATTPVPAALKPLSIEPARFAVVGQYYEPGASGINRLAPIPGLLGYVHGRPVDLRTGKPGE